MYKQAITLVIAFTLLVNCSPLMVKVVEQGSAPSLGPHANTTKNKPESESEWVVVMILPQMKPTDRQFARKVVYPERALAEGINGISKIQFRINENGQTEDHKIIQALGYGCDEAVIEALKQTEFEPGRNINRESVAFLWTIKVEFKAKP